MRLVRRYLPSPAMVVACLALLVALGGTSYAAIKLPRNSVGNIQLKRGAVTGIKVRSNTLTGTQINEGRLGRVPSARQADTAELAGEATSAPVSRLDYQSATVALPPTPGMNFVTRGTVSCPAGLNVSRRRREGDRAVERVRRRHESSWSNRLGSDGYFRHRAEHDGLRHLRAGCDHDALADYSEPARTRAGLYLLRR